MNVKDGGFVQRMVQLGWVQKGMKTVLEERGVDTHGMNAERMRNSSSSSYHITFHHCIHFL